MQTLNLPSHNLKITHTEEGDYVFDIIRKKLVFLTPEEWVRQHILHYLLKDLGYPSGLIKVESGVSYNLRMKRSDVVIYNNLGEPYILVECKAPNVKIDQSTLEQVAMYNKSLKASIIILTNGLTHYTFKIGASGELLNLEEIPKFER